MKTTAMARGNCDWCCEKKDGRFLRFSNFGPADMDQLEFCLDCLFCFVRQACAEYPEPNLDQETRSRCYECRKVLDSRGSCTNHGACSCAEL